MSSLRSNANFPGHDFSANSCIDGTWGMGDTEWSFCEGLPQANPWLSVQISSVSTGSFVTTVTIHGRSDCCQDLLGNYEVWVGNNPGDPLTTGASKCQPNDVLTAPATVGPFN
eukprot:6385530-Prymnesium_polylepis.1